MSARRDFDPTHYPVRDDVGEGLLQRLIMELLRPLVERWLAERGVKAVVGADQFFYWEQYNATKRVAPDVYVIPSIVAPPDLGCWKTWKDPRAVPSFAFEVVSQSDPDKDYLRGPARYAELGVRELVVFDPHFESSAARVRFQVFRKTPQGLLRVLATNADRVPSRALRCFLRAVGEGPDVRVRIGSGPEGDELFPTAAEAERERAEAERERAETEHERAETERERAETERERAERAEAELERLRKSLGRERARKR